MRMNRENPRIYDARRTSRRAASSSPLNQTQSVNTARIDGLQRFFWGALIISFPFTALEVWPSQMKTFGEPAVLIAGLLMGLIVAESVLRPNRIFIPKGRSALLLLLFILALGLSFFINYPINPYMWPGHNPWSKSARQLVQWLVDGSVVYFTVRFVQSWKDFRFALQCAFAGFFLTAGSTVLEVLAKHSPQSVVGTLFMFLHNGGMEAGNRLDLLAMEPAMAGDYLLLIVPLLICGAYYWKSRHWTIFWSAVALLLFCGTFSLGCFGALFAAALIVSVVYARRGSKGLLIGVFLLLSMLVGTAVSSSRGEEFLGDRIAAILQNGLGPSIPDFSTRQRLASAEATFGVFLEHPLTGVGIGKSPFYMYGAYPVWALNQSDVANATFWKTHSPAGATSFNLLVQMLAETGLIGTAIFVALLISMLADCYGAMNAATEKWKRRVFAGILFALVAQIIHYSAMSWLGMRYWFFIWGLAICAPRLLMQKDPKMPERRMIHDRMPTGTFEPRHAPALPAHPIPAGHRSG